MRRWMWVLIIVVVVLLGLTVAADRVGVSVAQGKVADELGKRAPFTEQPDVSIEGFPFITQAVSGTYDHITVDGDRISYQGFASAGFHADLRGVHVSASDAINGKVTEIPVDSATGWIVLPFSEVSKLGLDEQVVSLNLSRSGDDLVVSGKVSVPSLSISGEVKASGKITVNGNKLTVQVKDASVAGVALPPAALQAIEQQLGFSYDLPRLPYGLEIAGIDVLDNGVRVSGRSSGLVIG